MIFDSGPLTLGETSKTEKSTISRFNNFNALLKNSAFTINKKQLIRLTNSSCRDGLNIQFSVD